MPAATKDEITNAQGYFTHAIGDLVRQAEEGVKTGNLAEASDIAIDLNRMMTALENLAKLISDIEEHEAEQQTQDDPA